MNWAEQQQLLRATVLNQTLPAVEERLNKVDPVRTPEEEAVQTQIKTDAAEDLTRLQQAITDLATLLGDNTTTGSIRSWKQPIANNSTLTGAQGKALADLLISEAQATRRIARQVLRLARSMVGDYSSADVGAE